MDLDHFWLIYGSFNEIISKTTLKAVIRASKLYFLKNCHNSAKNCPNPKMFVPKPIYVLSSVYLVKTCCQFKSVTENCYKGMKPSKPSKLGPSFPLKMLKSGITEKIPQSQKFCLILLV